MHSVLTVKFPCESQEILSYLWSELNPVRRQLFLYPAEKHHSYHAEIMTEINATLLLIPRVSCYDLH